jgi:peptidoglycan pentaglycine glycine transferase (the first glycine)
MSFVIASEWREFVQQNPRAHILQTERWGILKGEFGWKPNYLLHDRCGALVLTKSYPGGVKLAYIPKGPVGVNWGPLWAELDDFCRKEHVVFLKVEPDQWEGEDPALQASLPSFHGDTRTIQPRQTIVISLAGGEEEWLERMKQKTRYNIRLAEKKEVRIIESDRVDIFNELMHATGERDAFGIHADAYYQRAFDLFRPDESCTLLLAMYGQEPLAGLMVFRSGKRAWYLYGASNEKERNRMPTYVLQWAAMQWAKRHGCEEYDLWGIPDAEEEVLERDFTTRSDGLWGVYRFKRGYGGEIKRTAGAWDKVYNRPLYLAYQICARKES